jgi:hypothetical protein
MKKVLVLVLVLSSLAACGGEQTPTPDLVATQIAVEEAAHATMTARVPTATHTPAPTPTTTAIPTPTGPTPTPPPTIEAEEYAVYSAMIEQNPIGYGLGSPIFIRDHTTSGAEHLDSALEYHRDLSAELVASFRSKSGESYTLEPSLELEQDHALLLRDEYDELFPRGGAKWDEFYTRYPEARGYLMFSRVGFDAGEDTALVEMGFRCGPGCAAGGLYLLVKEAGTWVVQGALMEWQS